MVVRKKKEIEMETEVLRRIRCEEGKMKQGRGGSERGNLGERTCGTEDVEVKEESGACVWRLGMCDGT